jgi:energy-coupling factor transport system ATP-binding protein
MPSEKAAEFEKEGIWLPHVRQARHRVQTGAEVLLSTRQLKVGYPGSPHTQPVLDLEVKQGNVLAVMGPNGVGKTALALTLGGLIPAHSGTVEASSHLSAALSSTEPIRWRSRELLNRIGSVFQAPEQQFITATVRDELCAGPRAVKMPPEQIDAQVEMLLDRLHLRELANAHPFTLSGGQQRRLSVGTALATKPPLVILDEPTFGQDASTWAEMVALIGELRDEGHGIVAVTHDQAFVEAVADSVVHVGASNGTH